jgi:hypothetical protein
MSNRDRLIITPGGPWRLYQHAALPGWCMLGTVQRGMEIGALAESSAGLLAQINAGAVRAMDQRKARAALAEATHDPRIPNT